ncbi:MAG TPA: hypothetical protein VFK17_07245 [Gaiellaceae bacterium]|nr:hypothetical protein [Gaiellaceae bacterium]
MRNPLRSEAEAFRFLLVVIAGAAVIIALAYANEWAGVAAAVLVVGGIARWLWSGEPAGPTAEAEEPLAPPVPPAGRRVLVLAAPDTVALEAPAADEVVVVVPALASPLEAVTGAVDERRAEAEATATRLAAQLPNARGVVGADDPVLAVEDALREFGADEVLVVGDDGILDAIRERVALPVSRA